MLHVMIATVTSWVVIALAVVFALFVTAAAARAQGRRLERRLVAQLGRRWDHEVREDPAVAPGDAVDGPRGDPELQITLEELLGQRDVLLEEFQAVQAQIAMLKRRVDHRRPVAADTEDDENVIRLHDVLPEEWVERRRR